MSTTRMTYDELYASMSRKFTIEKNNTDYTLGEYMLMRAKAKKENSSVQSLTAASASTLPTVKEVREPALVTVFSYVNEKLKVKEAPLRDKTIRSFPLRTSASAFCSALVICALVFGCGFFGLKSLMSGVDNTAAIPETEEDTNEKETNEESTVMNYYTTEEK